MASDITLRKNNGNVFLILTMKKDVFLLICHWNLFFAYSYLSLAEM